MLYNVARGLVLVQAAGVVVTLRLLGDEATALTAAGYRELVIMMIFLHLGMLPLLGV